MVTAKIIRGDEISNFDFSNIRYFGVSWRFEKQIHLIIVEGETKYDDYYCCNKTQVIGCIHLQEPTNDTGVVWMNYISVAEDMRGQGVASVLLKKLINVLKDKYPNRTLQRSETSVHAPDWIKSKIDSYLDKDSIKWIQNNYS